MDRSRAHAATPRGRAGRRRITLLALVLAAPLAACRSSEPAWSTPPAEPVEGVEHRVFHSDAMNADVGYSILLPPAYEASDRRYPVIYWLHGVGGNEGQAPKPVARPMIEAMTSGAAPPAIVVFVNGSPATFFANSPDGEIVADTAFIDELVPHVDATYRTIADRSGRSVEGFSMGGFAALSHGMRHPELFRAIVAYAPALLDVEELPDGSLTLARVGGTHEGGNPSPPAAFLTRIFMTTFGGRREAFDAYSPWVLVRESAADLRDEVAVRIVIGTADGLWNANQRFHELLLENSWEHELEVVDGVAHDITTLYARVGARGLAFHADPRAVD